VEMARRENGTKVNEFVLNRAPVLALKEA
jgi:hypothetical protein